MRKEHGEAAELMLAAGLEPITQFPGVDLPWRCIHIACGAEVVPTYTNVKRGQGGCLNCGQKAGSVRLTMPEADAKAIMKAHGLEPVEPYPGSGRPWSCRHTCGRTVSPTLSNVKAGKGICRYCNNSFPYDDPALLYLVVDRRAVKIGICALAQLRIDQHKRLGWQLAWTVEVPTGYDAYKLEQSIISWWRNDLCLPPTYSAAEMPQGGHTETANWDDMPPPDVLERVRRVANMLGLPPLTPREALGASERPTSTAGPLGVRARTRRALAETSLQLQLWE